MVKAKGVWASILVKAKGMGEHIGQSSQADELRVWSSILVKAKGMGEHIGQS